MYQWFYIFVPMHGRTLDQTFRDWCAAHDRETQSEYHSPYVEDYCALKRKSGKVMRILCKPYPGFFSESA